MCGLVAIVNFDGRPVDEALLSRMASRISHRGPDEEAAWRANSVGLYHKRLSIIDISSGSQPMSRQGVTVAFNGEIYNYLELRAELKSRGRVFTTESDTEVLLTAYLEYGADFVTRLNGMFAFVIYDERIGRVIAARDHFGVKPLYRWCTDEHLLYASEIKALLVHPAVRAEVNADSLADYVTFQHTLGEGTLFAGIDRVLPATIESVEINGGKRVTQERFWKPDYSLDHSLTEQTAVSNLRDLIHRSVTLQMRSDVPLGAYLSGGRDSSAVALLAADQMSQPLKTFTGAFREGLEFDESRFAAEVAQTVGAVQYLTYPTERDFIDSLSLLSYHMDEPAAGPGLFPQYMVSKLAADNVTVCLGGQGGDEIYGGYARHPIAYLDHALKAAIAGTPKESGDNITLQQLTTTLPALRQYVPMLKQFFSDGLFESPDRRYFSLLDRSLGLVDSLSNDFLKVYDRESVFDRFEAIYWEPETDSLLNRMTYFDMVSSLPALLQVEDRVSMAVSLESRVPLLDPDVVNFVATVPPEIKFKSGEMKYLFKQAVKDWLPDSIFRRTDKMGFPVPLHLWARGAAGEFIADVLLSRACRERGLFKPDTLQRLINSEAAFGRGLWGLLQIELWHRNFIDQDHHNVALGEQHAVVI